MVLQDTREREGWDFTFHGFAQANYKLKTGDYTLVKYRNVLCIERKRSTGELSLNLGKKSSAFFKELERMKAYPYRYIVFEFSEQDVERFPENSGIPKKFHAELRISANFMKSCIAKMKSDYDIEVIYAGNKDNAMNETIKIFNKVIEEDGNRRPVF